MPSYSSQERDDAIPHAVITIVSTLLTDLYTSHNQIDALFAEHGTPGEPPLGLNMVNKCRHYFKEANEDPKAKPLVLLGRVLTDFMEVDPSGWNADDLVPHRNKQRETIQTSLARYGLTYVSGRVINRTTANKSAPQKGAFDGDVFEDLFKKPAAPAPRAAQPAAKPPQTSAPAPTRAPAESPSSRAPTPPPPAHGTSNTRLAALLFLDVHGWSKLTAKPIREYVEHALPQIAQLLHGAFFKNTWGDGILATFSSASAAARAALDIRDFFTRGQSGIAEGMTCRISLHQGEVFELHNAIRGTDDYFGGDVHLAARLEPVTSPGAIFCTAQFALALNATREPGHPVCRPLGPCDLPEGHGRIDVFFVSHPNEPDRTEEIKRQMTASKDQAPPAGIFSVKDSILHIQEWAENRYMDWGVHSFTDVARECDDRGRVPIDEVKARLPQVLKSLGASVVVADECFTIQR